MEQKILIVDDEAHIRMLIEQTLEELEDDGVKFLIAENGEEALELITKEKPQLVFLDVMMPKMNGMEVCRQGKKRTGPAGYIYYFTDSEGTGSGPAERTGSGCGCIYDETL